MCSTTTMPVAIAPARGASENRPTPCAQGVLAPRRFSAQCLAAGAHRHTASQAAQLPRRHRANIACLKRAFGLAHCTGHGLAHLTSYAWSSVVAYNLARCTRLALAAT